MNEFVNKITNLSDWLWGPPLLAFIVFAGIFLAFCLRFFHIRYIGYIIGQTFGKMFDKSERGEGTLTPFQALTSALACTVGAGNIVGVPVAIALGGPGAIFWMLVVALIVMCLKYSEVVLAVKYREKNEEGEFVGGPMYYMTKGLNMKWLAVIFAVGLMVEVFPSIMVQANSVAGSAAAVFKIDPWITGIITTIITGIVVIGGIKRIGSVTEKFVPFMALLYVLSALAVIIVNIRELPSVIAMVFTYAFKPMSAIGGFAGSTVALSIRWGLARGVYSNESGVGTAPIAHATATADHPVRQGFWGIIEVFLDTCVICIITGLAVLCSGVWKVEGALKDPSALTSNAFISALGPVGGAIVTISLLLFVLSTVIVLIYYGEKQAEFLFGLKFAKIIKFIYVLSIPVGAVGGATIIWKFLDITLAMALIPNVLAVLLLNKEVIKLTTEFFSSEKYYLKDIKNKKNSKTIQG